MDESYGICLLTYIPVRSEPSEKAEMISQLLFGELFTIFETKKQRSFSRIKMVFDGYEGWIDTKTITPLDKASFAGLNNRTSRIIKRPLMLTSDDTENQPLWLSAGSIVNTDNENIKTGNRLYKLPADACVGTVADPRHTIISSGLYFLNVPYLWGGRSSFGVDCSGMVQNLFRQAGITLPRDASQQALYGSTLSFLSEAGPGDLAFFDNDEGEITHVGIIYNNQTIIHASGRVRIDRLDHQGIFSEELKTYTHKLRVVKRIFNEN